MDQIWPTARQYVSDAQSSFFSKGSTPNIFDYLDHGYDQGKTFSVENEEMDLAG